MDSWHLVLQCLTVNNPGQASSLADALTRLRDAGCRPFEAIVGSPHSAYGPRITVEPVGEVAAAAAELGFADHPWGPPSWYGLRWSVAAGGPELKPYHRMSSWPAAAAVPDGLPAGLVVDLAAAIGNRVEVYLRRVTPGRWADFCAGAAGLIGQQPPVCAPVPRDVVGAHCLSLSFTDDRLTTVTVYAQDRALPGDREIVQLWSEGLGPVDLRAYQAAWGGVRSESRAGSRNLHGLLAWSLGVDGSSSRAVSLRLSRIP